MLTIAFLFAILFCLAVKADKLEPVLKVVDLDKLGEDCKVRGTTVYVAVSCVEQFYLYSHTDGAVHNLVHKGTSVSSVEKTLDQGISFLEGSTLHHYDSEFNHVKIPRLGDIHYFLSDEINVLRNDRGTYTSFYSGSQLIRKLVLPAGVPYLWSATRTGPDMIKIITCIVDGSLCQFYELENDPTFLLTRVFEFSKEDETTEQLIYTGKFVGYVSQKVLRVYYVFDYILTTVYEDYNFDSELVIQEIQSTGTNNIWKRGSSYHQNFQWQHLNAIQLTNFAYIEISPRAYYDQH